MLASVAAASVILCCHRSSGAHFALKKIPKATATPRVFAEKSALQAVTHPYVLRFHRTFQDANHLYFLLELCRGGPLFEHVRAAPAGRLALDPFVRVYGAQLVLALRAMHDAGFAHRDLKANNVLLSERGDCRLIDLGFAKQLCEIEGGAETSEEYVRARTHSFCGTPHAMAPELLSRDTGGHGFGVDWWALGVLLFEMATGKPPFGFGVATVPDTGLGASIGAGTGDMLLGRVLAGLDGVVFPAEVFASDDGIALEDLIRRLLCVNLEERAAGEEVQAHAFFATIDWAALLAGDVKPPSPDERLLVPLVNSDSEGEAIDPDLNQQLFGDF